MGIFCQKMLITLNFQLESKTSNFVSAFWEKELEEVNCFFIVVLRISVEVRS